MNNIFLKNNNLTVEISNLGAGHTSHQAFFLTPLPSLSLCLFVKLIIAVERIML